MRALILASVFAGLSVAASAQQRETDLGSRIGVPYRARIPEAVGMSEADRGRVTMQQFATCVLDRSFRGIARALAQPSEEQQNKGLSGLATPECLDAGMMKFKVSMMRGAIFTELYRRRAAGRSGLSEVAPYDLSRAAGAGADATVYWWMMDFADCVVTRDRAAASGFVVTPVVVERETMALKNLSPDLGPCVTADQKLTLNRAIIKGALAEALYRGARPASAAEGKK